MKVTCDSQWVRDKVYASLKNTPTKTGLPMTEDTNNLLIDGFQEHFSGKNWDRDTNEPDRAKLGDMIYNPDYPPKGRIFCRKGVSLLTRLKGILLRLGMFQCSRHARGLQLKPYWRTNELVLLKAHNQRQHGYLLKYHFNDLTGQCVVFMSENLLKLTADERDEYERFMGEPVPEEDLRGIIMKTLKPYMKMHGRELQETKGKGKGKKGNKGVEKYEFLSAKTRK